MTILRFQTSEARIELEIHDVGHPVIPEVGDVVQLALNTSRPTAFRDNYKITSREIWYSTRYSENPAVHVVQETLVLLNCEATRR